MPTEEQTPMGETLQHAMEQQTREAIQNLNRRRQAIRLETLSLVREGLESRCDDTVPDLSVAERLCREGRAGSVEAGLLDEVVSLLLALEHLHLVKGAGIQVEESGLEYLDKVRPTATADAWGLHSRQEN